MEYHFLTPETVVNTFEEYVNAVSIQGNLDRIKRGKKPSKSKGIIKYQIKFLLENHQQR